MNKEIALNIIKQACASLQANLETHTQIQQAIAFLEDELQKKAKPVETPKK